jgi:presenilin-like A22 family membrane protease
MPLQGQLIIVTVLILSCLVVAYATDHRSRKIQERIKEDKTRLSSLMRGQVKASKAEISELERHLKKLEKELKESEQSQLLPALPEDGSLSEKLRSSLPIMIAIIVGAIGGVLLVVYLPAVVFVILITMAVFGGSLGLTLEFTSSERKASVLSVTPTAAYILTQTVLFMLGKDAFMSIFWLVFDIVIVMALIGVSLILGKQLPIEIVIILVLILSVWDVIAVVFTQVMANAVSTLTYTLPVLIVPAGTTSGGALVFSLLGGGDLFFSFLLVTTIARKLRSVPLALIGMIAASLLGLVVLMWTVNVPMAPALPAVSLAGVVSIVYYRKKLK